MEAKLTSPKKGMSESCDFSGQYKCPLSSLPTRVSLFPLPPPLLLQRQKWAYELQSSCLRRLFSLVRPVFALLINSRADLKYVHMHTHSHAGCLFTHWIADSLTLWKSPVTDEHLWTAARYYSILTRGQAELLYVIYTIIVLGGATIFWSLSDGEAGNLMFDGGSIGKQSVPQSTSLSHARSFWHALADTDPLLQCSISPL